MLLEREGRQVVEINARHLLHLPRRRASEAEEGVLAPQPADGVALRPGEHAFHLVEGGVELRAPDVCAEVGAGEAVGLDLLHKPEHRRVVVADRDVEPFDEIFAWPVGVADVGCVPCSIRGRLSAAGLVVARVDGYAVGAWCHVCGGWVWREELEARRLELQWVCAKGSKSTEDLMFSRDFLTGFVSVDCLKKKLIAHDDGRVRRVSSSD